MSSVAAVVVLPLLALCALGPVLAGIYLATRLGRRPAGPPGTWSSDTGTVR